ncbi:hypothetical protein PTTG_30520 [Puccinia triticina 1-1 BBBD Race 1]|uniref:Uncharacterized protein n=2 Tax=Puccinia triticina TaxID=208348 RepID=A0A180FYG0_PUCT1|nr:uncharacterized protein PtA15_9A418 [Puccinia triticina]OAV85446.1 hypothetical protein PTTG_30520 [Puccinia triticina 1-1 BBBD Race 1]WAQ88291.1 hypothetical protein PtA15_9A418 [Puccinia triticina]WAR60463.1 hypothetical protein PtB15_9B402 [Puccinia triticina]
MIQSLPSQMEKDYLEPQVVAAIHQLWQDPGVRKCFERSREYQLNNSAAYYFDSIDRIEQPHYVPDDQDILQKREEEMDSLLWKHDGHHFLVTLSEYNQMLYEDNSVNRMQESLNLFDSICNSRWLIMIPEVIKFIRQLQS